MATYTSNYNLYMPDSTDPVGDFRAEFNNNMNIIDNNMGGGGGGSSTLAGLTDVSLSSPTNGQVLTYDSVAQKWKNANGGGGGGGHNYSTSEQVIGTWVNGKPLYEISISIAGVSIPTNGTVTVYTDSVINLRHAEGCATENNIEYCVPETGIRIRQTGGDVQMVAVNGTSWVFSDGYLTIQYTKSTD